jgi:hypothetical protein
MPTNLKDAKNEAKKKKVIMQPCYCSASLYFLVIQVPVDPAKDTTKIKKKYEMKTKN